MAAVEEKPIREVFSLPILLADRAIKSAQEADSFRTENADLAAQLTRLSHLLAYADQLTSSSSGIYERPIRRVAVDVTKSVDRAFTLTRKCCRKKTNVLHHVLSITTAADFKKLSASLDSSLANMTWILSIFSPDSNYGTLDSSLPPFALSDPVLAWVWPAIVAVHMGRTEGASSLASLSRDSDRSKALILEENGIPPLLKMLKENRDPEAQCAAATALCNLSDDQLRVRRIAESRGVHIVAKALSEAPMRVQVILVNLLSKMSEMDVTVQEEFGKENVTRQLVNLLCMDVDIEETNPKKGVNSLHSVVLVNKEMVKVNGGVRFSSSHSLEAESPEVKLLLKVTCAVALWKLAKMSLVNSKKITETKALLVLAKLIEKEHGELKRNCLLVVMELAAVAESNSDLKRAAFRLSSTPAKSVLDQLLRVMIEETNPLLLTPAIKAIGCLSSMFPAKEKRIVQCLVAQLGNNMNRKVADEAAKALCKFVSESNHNCKEHSQAIIDFHGVPKIINLLRINRHGGSLPLHELVLLCHLAINVGNSKGFDQAGALSVLEGAARHVITQCPHLKELFAKSLHHLTIYQYETEHLVL